MRQDTVCLGKIMCLCETDRDVSQLHTPMVMVMERGRETMDKPIMVIVVWDKKGTEL